VFHHTRTDFKAPAPATGKDTKRLVIRCRRNGETRAENEEKNRKTSTLEMGAGKKERSEERCPRRAYVTCDEECGEWTQWSGRGGRSGECEMME
jgi:hypothetical protein